MENFVQPIGLIAGTLTTISFVPQILKIWKSKSADDVSTPMFLIFSTGVFLWLVYGVLIQNMPIIFFNFITLALSSVVIALKIKYRNKS